jgi:protein TonB
VTFPVNTYAALPPGSEVRSSAKRARTRRQAARERIHARTANAIDTPHLLRDPLERPASALRSTLTMARLVIIAAALHGLMLAVVFLGNQMIGSSRVAVKTERVKVRIVETRVQPPPPPPVVEEPVAPKVVPPPELAPPPPKREPHVRRPPQAPPPDPIKPTAPPTNEPPTRRVVGISMESAVEGGRGPAFAVGTSRMGETAPEARAPAQASKQPTTDVAPNRISTRFAEPDAPIVPPRRLAPSQPVYPPLLREQGSEADVVVSVTIAPDGRVVKVEIVRPAAEPAFNDSALAAARAERYAPATQGGDAVPYTQTYTIRFRLND